MVFLVGCFVAIFAGWFGILCGTLPLYNAFVFLLHSSMATWQHWNPSFLGHWTFTNFVFHSFIVDHMILHVSFLVLGTLFEQVGHTFRIVCYIATNWKTSTRDIFHRLKVESWNPRILVGLSISSWRITSRSQGVMTMVSPRSRVVPLPDGLKLRQIVVFRWHEDRPEVCFVPDIVRTATQWGHQCCSSHTKDLKILTYFHFKVWFCMGSGEASVHRRYLPLRKTPVFSLFFSRRFHGALVDLGTFLGTAALAMLGSRRGFTDATDNPAQGELGEHLHVFFRPQNLWWG